jgi:SAM-dependent methyltransferase
VPGQENIANLRALFPGRPYLGLDMRPGPGVDCVGDVEALPQGDGSVGTVFAMSTFEHVRRFWRGFAEVRRVLRPDGALIVSCPFYFYIHNYPADYWRFTPEAFDALLEDYPQRILGWHGPAKRPINVWAAAFREDHPPITPGQFERYRELLARHAHEPQSAWRRMRYQAARLLCGRGPFAPYLDHDRWETVWRTSSMSAISPTQPAASPRAA